MKASLITIISPLNFGAVLQAFATYKYLKKQNLEVQVIDYQPKYEKKFSSVAIIKEMAMQLLTVGRRSKLNKFYRNNFTLTSNSYKNYEELKASPPKADVYIVGSDQVWNSQISGGKLDSSFFLSFVEDKPKISYASSIGRTDVEINELENMKEYLKDFSSISVREESAKNLLSNVGVREIENVMDPVFLLEQEDYKEFIKPVNKKKYLLIYSFEKNDLIARIADDVSKKLGLQIIEIGTYRSKYSCDEYMQNIGVEGFLSLINDADFVITSSFHGTAFSALLNKQFVSVSPSVRKTRLENITSILDIKERLISSEEEYDLDDLLKPLDYEKVNKLISQHSNKSREFLKKALKITLKG